MYLAPLERIPHTAYQTTPPARPLGEVLADLPLKLVECAPMRCKLTPTACAARYRAANDPRAPGTVHRYPSCVKCRQGAETARTITKTAEKETPMTEITPYICIQCGINPAILAKKTQTPTHHLCRECFSAKIRAAYDKKKGQTPESGPPKRTMTLDFEGHPDIFNELVKSAHHHMRPVPMHAMWLLKYAVQKHPEGDPS